LFCVYSHFLQTVIKELNLKFKIRENPQGIKRETTNLHYCIMLINMETGQPKGILAHLQQ